MGLICHRLKAVRSLEWPRNIVWVHSVPKVTRDRHRSEDHQLMLAAFTYYRRGRSNNPERLAHRLAHDADSFWTEVMALAEADRQLVVVAFNAGYDSILLDTFRQLARRGWRQQFLYYRGRTTILAFEKDGRKLRFVGLGNYLSGTLLEWASRLNIGLPVAHGRRGDLAAPAAYAEAAARVLEAAWRKWHGFCLDNGLGKFALTASGQAFNAFRRRFMKEAIYIHNNPKAIKLERAGYLGSRVECGRLGACPGGPFYTLDVNGMYPYIMRDERLPCRLKGRVLCTSVPALERMAKRHGVMAEVLVKTDEPAYPCRKKHLLLFPVGTFWTTLATPELRHALAAGRIVGVRQACLYDREVLFREYILFIRRLRSGYRRAGDKAMEEMCKLMANSLYGKFGQQADQVEEIDCPPGTRDGEICETSDVTGETWSVLTVAGQSWQTKGKAEAFESFPAIAAHVTSAARLYLWELMCQCGLSNVLYCDTDSIVTTAEGVLRLEAFLHPSRLGAMKLKDVSDSLYIGGAKRYRTDHLIVSAGLKSDAELVEGDTWEQSKWNRLQTCLAKGTLDTVTVRRRTVTHRLAYPKGAVLPDGAVVPFELSEA